MVTRSVTMGNRAAKGTVIEARLDRTRGPIATLLIQNGTLNQGDVIIAGTAVGRVRVMTNDKGRTVKTAGPSVPVEITGLADVPAPGDEFNAVSDERMARELVEQRRQAEKDAAAQLNTKITLDNLFAMMQEGEMKDLNLIVKADVQGSAEALKASLLKLSNDEVRVKVIHTGVGAVNESDILLASTANAIIIGFNVRPDAAAQASAQRAKVDVRMYRVIYDAINEIEAALKGMLAPKYQEVVIGHAEVRQTYKVSAIGTIAGCYAGNVSAYELQGGEYLLDWVDLKPDTVFLRPGDTMTVENVAEHPFGVEASWLLSDDTVAEIVESDSSSCVIRGLKPGEVQVCAGFNDYRKAVTVTVIDPDVVGRYTDIGNHWARDSMEAALTLGFFRGTSATTFSPEKTLTRAEMVTVLHRMAGTPEVEAENPFRDVAPDRWYTDAITWAAANGIVQGKTADRFDPNAPVTREQIASILYRYATYLGMDVSARSELSGYGDAGKISNYAKEAMSWAVATGLIRGITGTVLSPGGSATRAQAATLAIRFRGL